MFWRLKSCRKCGGDLVLDEGDWRCVQCAQYYYPSPNEFADPLKTEPTECGNGSKLHYGRPAHLSFPGGNSLEGFSARRCQSGYEGGAKRSINKVIRANKSSDERWRKRNEEVIEYLSQGLRIHEIAALTDRGERQIRGIRERFYELLAQSETENT